MRHFTKQFIKFVAATMVFFVFMLGIWAWTDLRRNTASLPCDELPRRILVNVKIYQSGHSPQIIAEQMNPCYRVDSVEVHARDTYHVYMTKHKQAREEK